MSATRRGIRPVLLRVAFPACLAAGLLLLAGAPRAAAQGSLKEAYLQRFVGRPAPPFLLKDLEGREVRLSDHKGKVIQLNYWYTGCFPCRQETPDLIRLYNAPKDLQGRLVRLSDLRGKVVLLNFWYSGCMPCRKETPELASLYRLRKDQGLVILGINLDAILMPADDRRMLQRFVQDFEIPYPTLIADVNMYDDYGKPSIAPLTLLIDRQGRIAQVFWGAYCFSVYENAVRPYLEASGP